MKVSEDQLQNWARAVSDTEQEKYQNTITRITKALRQKFGDSVSIFLQGSYRNSTNVRLESDVDIVVRHEGYYFPDVGLMTLENKQLFWSNFQGSDYTFSQFKNEVQAALLQEFDAGEIVRKSKCIRVNKNSYRVNADVVPCFVHKRFNTPYYVSAEGIELETDNGTRISSFPIHHYQNGVTKHGSTSNMYKPLVRILKNVRHDLADKRIITLEEMPSFFLECLVWNVTDPHFQKQTYQDAIKAIITRIWNDMRSLEKAQNYAEVSDLFWLFKGQTMRSPQQAETFMLKAWKHLV